MKDASTYYRKVGEQLGMAGHAASEHLQVEFKAVDLATEALVGITLSPPPVEF